MLTLRHTVHMTPNLTTLLFVGLGLQAAVALPQRVVEPSLADEVKNSPAAAGQVELRPIPITLQHILARCAI